MNLDEVLDLGHEKEWDFSIDVDRIPSEVFNRSGPTIPETIEIPEHHLQATLLKAPTDYKSIAAYLLLSAAVHGVIVPGIRLPLDAHRLDSPEEQQQELLEDYLDHRVPLAIGAQIPSKKETESLPKDITEVIDDFQEKYSAKKIELIEDTAEDLADGKLDDISLAKFVLTLQALRYNSYTLLHDDYPLEKLYDVPTILDDFGKRVKEAKEITGISCDLDSLVKLHSFVFSKVIHTGYDQNRDSVLSALNGMSQCESGSEGYVLLEDERSGCPDVGLIFFGDHIEIGTVRNMHGYAFWAEPGKPPHKYTEGKFIPKEVLAALYLVKEGVPLEQFPEAIRKYFRDDPALDKANDVSLRSKANSRTLTEEPWAAKAHIPTRANKGGTAAAFKIRYWDNWSTSQSSQTLSSRSRSSDQLEEDGGGLEQRIDEVNKQIDKTRAENRGILDMSLSDCVEEAGKKYAVMKVKQNRTLRVLPKEILQGGVLLELRDTLEGPYLLHMAGIDSVLEVERDLERERDRLVRELRESIAVETVGKVETYSFKVRKYSLLEVLASMPGAEKEAVEVAQEFLTRSNLSDYYLDVVFRLLGASKQPEVVTYLEQVVRDGLKQGDRQIASLALYSRTDVTSNSGRRIPFQILTQDEIDRASRLNELKSEYRSWAEMPQLAGTNPKNPIYRNIARHILFGETLDDGTVSTLDHDSIKVVRRYRSVVAVLPLSVEDPDFYPSPSSPLSIYSTVLDVLIELKDRSSCEDLYKVVLVDQQLTQQELEVMRAMVTLDCDQTSDLLRRAYRQQVPEQVKYVQERSSLSDGYIDGYSKDSFMFRILFNLLVTYDPHFPQEEMRQAIETFDFTNVSKLSPTLESARFLRRIIDKKMEQQMEQYRKDEEREIKIMFDLDSYLLIRLAQIEGQAAIPYLRQKYFEMARIDKGVLFDATNINPVCTALIYAQNPELYKNDVHPPQISRSSEGGRIFRLEFSR